MEILQGTGRKSDWKRREDILPAERNDMSSWATTIKTALSTVKRYKKHIIGEKNYNFPEQEEDLETGLFNKGALYLSAWCTHSCRDIISLRNGSSCQIAPEGWGREGGILWQSKLAALPTTTWQLWAMPTPILSPHPFPQSVPSEAERSFHEVRVKVSFSLPWADHLILASAAELCPTLISSWPWKYYAWSIFPLATYLLSFSLWHLPCFLKRQTPLTYCTVKICMDGDFKEVNVIM